MRYTFESRGHTLPNRMDGTSCVHGRGSLQRYTIHEVAAAICSGIIALAYSNRRGLTLAPPQVVGSAVGRGQRRGRGVADPEIRRSVRWCVSEEVAYANTHKHAALRY